MYKNNTVIGTGLTEAAFVDEDVEFGIHYQYYVRTVANDGVRSNPSNITTAFVAWHDPVPTELAAALMENTVSLTWQAPEQKSLEIYYGLDYCERYMGIGVGCETYWGQKYPASSLSAYQGMEISQVSFYASFTGDYTLYLFKGNTSSPDNMLIEQQHEAQSTGWQNISLSNPAVLDCNEDLWVVFKSAANITYPAAYGIYDGDDLANARFISDHLALTEDDFVDRNISWIIKVQLSDGEFSYNVYRDGQMVGEGLLETHFTDEGLENGTYNYHVKSVSNGHLSSASENASATVSLFHVAAYYSERQLFAQCEDGNCILEIIDATGRVIMTENVNCYISKSISLKPGVYIARMVSGNRVKTQKFVAE